MTPPSSVSRPSRCDVVVVGGGINGVGIARDLAGRGLKVILAEKDDLASHTSSASTKLIHGGLRYLEHHAFGLVRKALQEREVLMRCAPHIIRPMQFVMPHDPSMRPAWMIKLGLWLYDHLARREFLPASSSLSLKDEVAGHPLKPHFTQAFVYADGWVDDSRLVVLNAMDARAHGAHICTRTRCVSAVRGPGHWVVTLASEADHESDLWTVEAPVLVNATGPWAAQFLKDIAHPLPGSLSRQMTRHNLRLVKGSHIVLPRLFDHDEAYLFQAWDGRVVFAIPYEDQFTLVGTTDVEVKSLPHKVQASDDEVAYLCEQVNRYVQTPISPDDVCWQFAGIRPLLEDVADNASAVTRDYLLETQQTGAPLMTVWGGKITTYRKLAEEAGHTICALLGDQRPAWTGKAILPGGAMTDSSYGHDQRTKAPSVSPTAALSLLQIRLTQQYPWVPAPWLRRWVRTYGTCTQYIIGSATSLADLEPTDIPGICMAELRYLVSQEWARTGEDVLWRRTKLGLHLTRDQQDQVHTWVNALLHPAPLTSMP